METYSLEIPLERKGRVVAGADRTVGVVAEVHTGQGDYEAPFAFTGDMDKVSVTVGEQGTLDKAKILEAALAEQ